MPSATLVIAGVLFAVLSLAVIGLLTKKKIFFIFSGIAALLCVSFIFIIFLALGNM